MSQGILILKIIDHLTMAFFTTGQHGGFSCGGGGE